MSSIGTWTNLAAGRVSSSSSVPKEYAKTAAKLSRWIESDIPEGWAVLQLPPSQRVRLRTSNMLERLNQEITRRACVATLFPNEASLLRLVSAVLIETSEEWEIYLKPEPASETVQKKRLVEEPRGGANEPPLV